MRKPIAAITTGVLTLVGVGTATVAYSASEKTVRLAVDGETRTVETLGSTVGDVLEDEGVEVGEHDVVAPSPEAPVEDGTRVAVRHGRQLTVSVDGGEERTSWVTADRVGPALAQAGHRFPAADLAPDRDAPVGRDGAEVAVTTEKRITLVDGEKTSTETVPALTAGEALRDLDVGVDRNDEVLPREHATIEDGSHVRVVHVRHALRRVREEVPNETVVRHDDDLAEGREKVRRAGRDGLRVETYKVVLRNGEPFDRTRLESAVRRKPLPRVEVHGTDGGGAVAQVASAISDAPCDTGSAVEDGLTANAVAVHRAVCAVFPQVDTYYGLRVGDPGEHGDGRALDIMISDSSLGDRIAEWVRAHHAELGVTEVIWSQQIWSTERSSEGWRYMEDRGSPTANHEDHVHVTVQ